MRVSGTTCAGHGSAPFGDCCNGENCPGTCVAESICCAVDRACPPGGSTQCCPSNYTCEGDACVPCGCPENQECCPGGTDACCTPPFVCCEPEGRPKGCYAVNDCLGLH